MKNFIIIILLSPFILTLFYGCESNDAPTASVYIPQPVNKKVVIEFFTNSGCVPCVNAHNYFNQIKAAGGVTINDTSVVLVVFHSKYPFIYDSLYLENQTQNDARSAYYAVLFTPQSYLNGVTMGQFSATEWTARINAEFKTTRFLDISLSRNFNSSTDSGTITANVKLLTSLSTTDNVIHIVLTESSISYDGGNGIKIHDYVVRNMVTGSNGEPISLSQGQTTTVNKNFGLKSKWNEDNCYLSVYVQSTSTKKVYGVERVKIK